VRGQYYYYYPIILLSVFFTSVVALILLHQAVIDAGDVLSGTQKEYLQFLNGWMQTCYGVPVSGGQPCSGTKAADAERPSG